jgi:hypothetical protein
MTDNDPFGQNGGQNRQPWFGPRQFGFGYGPRTWQGYLLTALAVGFVIAMAAITGGHSPWMILGIIPAGIVTIIARTQGRRR